MLRAPTSEEGERPKAAALSAKPLLRMETSRARVKSPMSVSCGRASARVLVMRPRRSSTRALAARSMGFSWRARARAPARSRVSGARGASAGAGAWRAGGANRSMSVPRLGEGFGDAESPQAEVGEVLGELGEVFGVVGV